MKDNHKPITRLQLINGGNTPRPDTVLSATEERVTCHVCMNHEGVDTVEFIPVSTHVVRVGNEMRTTISRMACFSCLQKGRKTYIT